MRSASQVRSARSMVSAKTLETLFEPEKIPSSSSDPPPEDWSSLESVVNPKWVLSQLGYYHPGSGNVCAKYIPLSDSEVAMHSFYQYPAVTDPGIVSAVLDPEPPKIYGSDGQELYLDLCEEFKFAPVADFHRGLLKDVINLRYYCVNPDGVSVMCKALSENRIVQSLDLTSSFLNLDACYHLGQLLVQATGLKELILTQCRIGPQGLTRLVEYFLSRKLEVLDLSKNQIGDVGMTTLADVIAQGAVIKKLNLSYNGLKVKAALDLSKALSYNVRNITHLDLSWNEFYTQRATKVLIVALCASKVLEDLNLSWNSISGGPYLGDLIQIETLQRLNLSNNKLASTALSAITSKLINSKTLKHLDLSGNPLAPTEAYMLLKKMRMRKVKLQNLLMDDVVVTKEFAEELKYVLSLKYRQNAKITHGRLLGNYTLAEADMRTIVMKRLYFLGKRGPKKGKIDIPAYFLKKRKKSTVLIPKQMQLDMKLNGSVQIGENIISELTKVFPGPKIDHKSRAIDLERVADFVARMWPDARPLSSPPESLTISLGTKGKGNKGKSGKAKPDKVKKGKGKGKKKK